MAAKNFILTDLVLVEIIKKGVDKGGRELVERSGYRK
jgi:hypothetical protein